MPRLKIVRALLRVMLKTFSFDISFTGGSKKPGKKNHSMLIMIIILLVSLAPLGGMGGYMVSQMYDFLSPLHMQNILLNGFTSLAALVIFIFGIANVMAVFYYAGDTERYLSLPIKPVEILTAKFFTTVVYEYIISFIAVLPVFCIYGVKSGAGPIFYLYSIIVALLIPIIPIALAALPVMLLMRFTRFFRNRDAVNLFFMMLLVVVIMVFQISFSDLVGNLGGDKNLIAGALTDKLQEISGSVGNAFVGTSFAATAVAQSHLLSGLLNLLFFALCTLAVFILFIIAGDILYFKGVLGLSQTATGKKMTLSEMKQKVRQSSVWGSLMRKDFLIILRTPVFFLNNLFMVFFLPIALAIFAASPELINDPKMAAMGNFIQSLSFNMQSPESSMAIFAAFAGGALMGSMNSIAASALSREGRNFNIMKIIPVSFHTQIYAKVGLGFLCSMLSSLLTLILLNIFIEIPLFFTLLLLVPMILGALIPNFVGILAELLWPKLLWDNEQKAVKQNLNVLFEIFAGFGLAALAIGGNVLLPAMLPLTALLLTTGVGLLLSYVLYILIKNLVPKQMKKLYV